MKPGVGNGEKGQRLVAQNPRLADQLSGQAARQPPGPISSSPGGRTLFRLMSVARGSDAASCVAGPDRFDHIVGGASPERITANAVADRRVAGSQHPPGIVKARDHLIAQSTR